MTPIDITSGETPAIVWVAEDQTKLAECKANDLAIVPWYNLSRS